MSKKLECVDVGSDFCPCYLAETNDCITCSILQGKDFCDCNWRGTCIYQEYVWNGNKRKESREITESDILEKIKINDEVIILKLKVTKTLARQLREPGSYIFIRNINTSDKFNIPMSVMDSNEIEGYIYIAYHIVGTKTKRINLDNKKLLIKGPYWNGVFGLKNLKRVSNEECLIVTRGISQAPALLVIKKLIKNKNNVTFILDKGRMGKVFIKQYMKQINTNNKLNIIESNVKNAEGKNLIKDILIKKNIKLIYSGGSDSHHYSILNIIDNLKVNPLLVITNNNKICCGEGVCGACSYRDSNGTVIKTCKTQVNVRNEIKRRVLNG